MGLLVSCTEPRRVNSSDVNAAAARHGDPKKEDKIGGEGFTGPHAGPHAEDVSSDSDTFSDRGTDYETDKIAGPQLSSSLTTNDSAAIQLDGDFMLHQAEENISGGACFTMSCAEDEFSDSESEDELESESESDAEELYKLGDARWIDEECLASFAKPKDMAIILYQTGEPGDEGHYWMAIAPEWTTALDFGSTKEEACHDLEIKLVMTKEWFIEDKLAHAIKKVPLTPCKENADKLRHSWWEADYYDKLEKECTYWEWSTVRA